MFLKAARCPPPPAHWVVLLPGLAQPPALEFLLHKNWREDAARCPQLSWPLPRSREEALPAAHTDTDLHLTPQFLFCQERVSSVAAGRGGSYILGPGQRSPGSMRSHPWPCSCISFILSVPRSVGGPAAGMEGVRRNAPRAGSVLLWSPLGGLLLHVGRLLQS